jgi:Fibronectin type III domain
MPTISQLPPANAVSATDEVPISQAGTARSASVGELLASVQPVINVNSPSLLGRTSMGSGGPEQVDLGLGISLSSGTLVADGLDHAAFALIPSLSLESDLVISNQGVPTLMQASLLRGLFAAGQNVAIDANGVISATAETIGSASSIGALSVVTELTSQDLVAVSQSGTNCAITYSNLLDGITIDQGQSAAVAGDSDTTWVAQGSDVMTRQTFAAIWVWIASKLPTYEVPVVEIDVDTNLDITVHNGRLLICSQPVTLTPLKPNMGNGFQCTVINASAGDLTLGSGFISSSGSLVLTPWQSATLSCATYSAGTVAFAAMPTAASAATLVPGQVIGISSSSPTSSTITASWQAPSSGGAVSSYIVQYRPTGATPWSGSSSVVGATVFELTALQAATSYDIIVQAQNAAGAGPASSILTAMTSSATVPS